MIPLKTQAIQTALQGDWQAAVILNQMLLEENPNDIDALNRLAFAKTSLGDLKEAKLIYQKVLILDINNPIALKNLQRLPDTTNGSCSAVQPKHVSNVFIEESGKTKVIELINTADKKIIAPLRNGEHLTLSVKRMKIFILDYQKQYIGMLHDDLGNRLIKFINGGNQYEAYVKTIHNNKVIILLKEVKRANKFKNQPSFFSIDKSKFVINSPQNQSGKNKKTAKNKYSDDAQRDLPEDDES